MAWMSSVLNGGDIPVVVDGRFTGEIHAKSVTLGEYGIFFGKLFAEHVEIGGQFNGELVSTHLMLVQQVRLMARLKRIHCQSI